jgi:phage-related protein
LYGRVSYARSTIDREGAGWNETIALDRQQQASSKKDLSAMPIKIRRAVGYALFAAQQDEKHKDAKVLTGFGDAGVLEIIAQHDGDTFRAVYTVRFADVVYVLHAFQKKSKRGAATPKSELDLIRKRLKVAETEHKGKRA